MMQVGLPSPLLTFTVYPAHLVLACIALVEWLVTGWSGGQGDRSQMVPDPKI